MRTILSAAILAALFAMPANAQSVCFSTGTLKAYAEKLKAEPTFDGVTPSGTRYIILTNTETGHWVALKRGPELTCFLVEGVNFSIVAPKK